MLTSLGEDAAGCVYATSGAGTVYRLVEQDTRIPCALPAGPPAAGPTPIAKPIGRPGATVLRGVRAKRRQRVLQLGGAVVRARCATACRVAAGGRLRVGAHVYRLRRVSRRADVAISMRLKPRLTQSGRDALRAALDAGRHPRVRSGCAPGTAPVTSRRSCSGPCARSADRSTRERSRSVWERMRSRISQPRFLLVMAAACLPFLTAASPAGAAGWLPATPPGTTVANGPSGAVVAVDPAGDAIAAWTDDDGAGSQSLVVATRPAGGPWAHPHRSRATSASTRPR